MSFYTQSRSQFLLLSVAVEYASPLRFIAPAKGAAIDQPLAVVILLVTSVVREGSPSLTGFKLLFDERIRISKCYITTGIFQSATKQIQKIVTHERPSISQPNGSKRCARVGYESSKGSAWTTASEASFFFFFGTTLLVGRWRTRSQ